MRNPQGRHGRNGPLKNKILILGWLIVRFISPVQMLRKTEEQNL